MLKIAVKLNSDESGLKRTIVEVLVHPCKLPLHDF